MTQRKRSLGEPLSRRAFLKVFGLTTGPFVLGGLSGCRPTDTLTNIVYADWATDIDYDNPAKSLKNAPNKKPTTSLPKLYETKSESVEQKMEEPVYDEQAAPSETKKAPQTEYKKDAEKVDNTKGKKKKKSKKETKKKEKAEKSYGKKQAQVGGNEVGTNASKDVTSEPDQEGSIIAFGEIANIVALLGGRSALWAADDEFVDTAKTFYASKTFLDTTTGYWPKYSTSSTTLNSKKFSNFCKLLDKAKKKNTGLPAYFIYDGSVGCPITDDQAAHLEDEYGIKIVYFFLTTYDTLKNAMNYIRKILKSNFEFDANDRYEQYWDFHDTLLSEINGGKVAAWNSETKSLMNFKDGGTCKSSKVLDAEEVYWTLFINGWDKDVEYNSGGIKAINGLGYSTLGWKWSPVNYYLQCGGVLNNAAARYQAKGNSFNAKTEYHRYVWQMGLYYYKPVKNLSNATLTDEQDRIGSDDGDILMRAQSGEFGLGKLAGVGRFPAVIVPTKNMKKRMEKDRDHSSGKGVYAPHYLEANETANNVDSPIMGVAYEGTGSSKKSAWISYIGREEGSIDERTADTCVATEEYKTNSEAYDVLVNPHGVYSDWISGSVESFLEAPWAYENIAGGSLSTSAGSSTKAIIQSFYEQFYGGSLSGSDASSIIDGDFAS